jgi:hypothetical protein
MSVNPTYWKMRNGDLISIDDMDINHLRNTLKMIVKNSNKHKKQVAFELKGDMANEFNNSHLADKDDDRFDNEYNYNYLRVLSGILSAWN